MRRVLAIAAVAILAACSDDASAPSPESGDVDVAAPTTADTAATPGDTTPGDTSPAATAPAESGGPPTTTTADAGPPPTGAPGADPAVSFTEVALAKAPVDLAWRDGDDGLYVVEQGGRILRVAPDGSTTTVLDATDLTDADGERGLLGLAFAPSGDLAYTNYTDLEGNTTIAEYPVEADGTFLDGDNSRVLFVIEQPYPNHNGGDLTFGPDGLLYIGMGDGGAGDDPDRRATDLADPLGKLLRIDPAPAGSEPYTVPADNPFVDQDDADPRIWSSGLRNPWRFSFDRTTGDLWIGDVGQNYIEEIDVAPATSGVDAGKGLSFGWSAFEGDDRYNEDVADDGHTAPIATYPHENGDCSISGGVRARDGSSLDGWYVYGDYCSGRVAALEGLGAGEDISAGRSVELGQVGQPTAVVDGPAGELYVLVNAPGQVLRLDPA